jgi:hypothetical protein
MAVSGAIIDYTGAGGERNYTLFIQLTFSGSFPAGGDPLNLTTLSNPNGLDLEGLSELPLSIGPSVYLEDIGGYYVQPKVTGSTLNAFLINVYAPGGAIVTAGTYPTQVSGGNVILTVQKRRV